MTSILVNDCSTSGFQRKLMMGSFLERRFSAKERVLERKSGEKTGKMPGKKGGKSGYLLQTLPCQVARGNKDFIKKVRCGR